MPSLAVALKLINVALRSFTPGRDRLNLRAIGVAKPERADRGVSRKVRARRRADYRRGDAFEIESEPARHGRDVGAVSVGDPTKHAKKLLKQRPSSEIVEDQLVFDKRSVRERPGGLGPAQPAVRKEAAGGRPVAKQTYAMGLTERGETVLWPAVENRILHLHGGERD